MDNRYNYIITQEDMDRGYMIVPDDAPAAYAGTKLAIKACKGDILHIPKGMPTNVCQEPTE